MGPPQLKTSAITPMFTNFNFIGALILNNNWQTNLLKKHIGKKLYKSTAKLVYQKKVIQLMSPSLQSNSLDKEQN